MTDHIAISDHAVARFQERIRNVAPEKARVEMMFCLMGAKAKKLRPLSRGSKRTIYVPTGCCMFICAASTSCQKRQWQSKYVVVTVVERPDDGNAA